ncbi:sushi, von Willebrand factor type A, EGF and pentraxin domain-containing protein 1-like [Ciona intestinalis]
MLMLYYTGVKCRDPGPISSAKYYLPSEEVDFEGVIKYKCLPGFWIRPGVISAGVTCNDLGEYNPHPSSISCTKTYCSYPPYVPFAQHSQEIGATGENVVTYQCFNGHWIQPNVYKSSVVCKSIGSYQPDPRSITCARISCPPAYYLLNGTISGSSVDAGAQKTITCDIGFWINKETKLREETITCDMKKGIWMRPDVACIETLCDDPGDLVGAHRYREPASLKYKEKMVYRCNEGYEYVVNKTTKREFLTTCGSDGVWEPDLNHIECKRIECNFTVEHYDHGDILHSSNGTFYYGDQVKLECIHGYWVYLDKGMKSINFTCSETQLFYPNPLYVKCSVVECPKPPELPHTTLDANHTSYKSVATYTCHHGYGSSRKPPKTEWSMTCMVIGLWSVNPNVVECNLIDCGEPNHVQYATMIGENFTYNSIIQYECVKGKWFSRGVYGKTITCLVDSSWNATYTSCIDVECPHPSSVTNHATYIGEDLTYLNLITVYCNHGYMIAHGVAHATLRCMGNGSWDLPNDKFTCKPVVCPTPPPVWYSNTIGTNYSLDATVIYDCNHDYFISRSQDNITITCTDVAIWRPNPKLIKCIRELTSSLYHAYLYTISILIFNVF